jgi:hypothetical protein
MSASPVPVARIEETGPQTASGPLLDAAGAGAHAEAVPDAHERAGRLEPQVHRLRGIGRLDPQHVDAALGDHGVVRACQGARRDCEQAAAGDGDERRGSSAARTAA